MATRTVRMAAPIIALMLSGCGEFGPANGLTRLEQLYPTPPATDAGSFGFGALQCAEADGGTVSEGPVDAGTPQCTGDQGLWAVRLIEQGTIEPTGPPPWDMTITDLFLASSNGSTVSMTFCNEDVSIVAAGQSTNFGQTVVPCPLATALAAQPITFSIPAGEFSASNVVWLWGLQNFANPLTAPLPTTVDDPSVWDQDGDGNPGITLQIINPAGDRYMVRRAIWQFGPSIPTLDSQWITGNLTVAIDESVLGASNGLLLTNPPIVPASGSVYQFRCIGQGLTCNNLSQNEATIFQGAPDAGG